MPRRPADIFAGEGSVAGKLRTRREAIEAGDTTGGRKVNSAPKKKKPAKKKAAKKKETSKPKRTLRDVLLSKPAKDKRDPMRRGQ
jgi:hypothetical protein